MSQPLSRLLTKCRCCRTRHPLLRQVASGIRCKPTGVVSGFVIRLGDGTDSFGAVGGPGGGDGVWPQLGGGFEQRAALGAATYA